MHRLLVLVPALLSAACATVHQPDHTGFHFDADIGVGGSSSKANDDLNTEVSGAGVTFGVGGGYAVVPNLIVGAQLWGTSVPDPDVRDDYYGSSTANDWTYGVVGVGPMVRYYFMPINLYLSATPSIARMTLHDDGNDDNYGTRWGPALRTAVGKEWFIANRWGMGVAGVLDFASNKDNESNVGAPTWKTVGGGVVFSVSFN